MDLPHLLAVRGGTALLALPVYVPESVDVRTLIVICHDALTGRAIFSREIRNCRNQTVNRGAILCSRKQGSAPAGNTIEKANRDEHYASLLASMQNNSGPKPAVKNPASSLSPPLMRSTMHTPTEGRDSTAMSSAIADAAITILAVPARIAAN